VQLRSIDSGQIAWTAPASTAIRSDVTYASEPLPNLSAGAYALTMFVNAIPSMGTVIRLGATYGVLPSAGPNGAISPATLQTVNEGATTTFTVTPLPGYSATIAGTCGGSLSATTYTTDAIIANCTVDATFTLNTYSVTPSAGANGTINPSTPQTIDHGATAVFIVTPGMGYSAMVTGSCGGSLSGTTYTTNAITADCTVDATFTINSYTVMPSAGPNGTINPSTPQTVLYGATTVFTVTPDIAYSTVVGGSCGGNLVGAIYTTNPVSADCTVDASFPQNPPPLVDPLSINVDFNTAQTITLSASDPNGGGPFTFAIATPPSHGTVSLNGDTVTYTPGLNEFGADAFTYTASNVNGTSLPATVNLLIARGTVSIPTLNTWGLLLLMLVMLGVGMRRVARRLC
jgi:hypothetical protein